MSRTHHLKIWPAFFAAVRDGSKPFEVRNDDRGYAVGDVLVLREWDPSPDDKSCTPFETFREHRGYTGEQEVRVVTYVLRGWGVSDGYVALGLCPLPDGEEREGERAT